MNTEYMDYCFKSIKRRKKNIIKTSFTIFIVFAAVTLLILIRTNCIPMAASVSKGQVWKLVCYDVWF